MNDLHEIVARKLLEEHSNSRLLYIPPPVVSEIVRLAIDTIIEIIPDDDAKDALEECYATCEGCDVLLGEDEGLRDAEDGIALCEECADGSDSDGTGAVPS